MHKILIVAKNVFFNRILKPTYYWMIIAPLILSLGAILFNNYLNNQDKENKPQIAVIAPENIKKTIISQNNQKYTINKNINSMTEGKRLLLDGPLDGILYVPKNFKNVKFIYNNLSSKGVKLQDLQTDLNSTKALITANRLNLSANDFNDLFSNIKIKETAYNSGTKKEKPIYNGYSATQLFSEAIVVIMFFLLTSYISITGTEIGKEKGDHILESILASMPPKQHFAGKMLGISYLMSFQIFIYGILFISAKLLLPIFGKQKWLDLSMFKGITLQYAVITIFLMITAIMLYVLLSALIASFVSRTEDISQATSIVGSCMLVPYFISFLTQDAPNNSISISLSFIPFVSHSIMPIRLSKFATTYNFGWISVLINVVMVVIMYKLTSEIYSKNSFKYSKDKPVKSLIKSLKNTKKILINNQ